MAVLSIEHLSAGYRMRRNERLVVVSNVSVTLGSGELVCLLGPNGAGKSTLMRTVAGMQHPLSGTVRVDGKDIHRLEPIELARQLSVVLTDRVSVGMFTGYDLVALGRYPYTDWTGRLTESDHAAIESAIEAVGAEELASHYVGELSDGQRQKIMIARALAQETPIMILDEITAFLDLPNRVEVMRTLRDLAHEKNKAILLSSHDLDLSLRCADCIWLLAINGQLQTGSPNELIASGAFETIFHAKGATFDRTTGSFHFA